MRFPVALLFGLLLTSLAPAQSPEVRFTPLFDNTEVSVYRLELKPGERAAIFQNTHDVFWIALDGADLVFVRDDDTSTPMRLQAGDTRYFPSFAARQVRNAGDVPFRGVLVEIKPHGLVSAACDCLGRVEKALCGCPDGEHLPDMWAAGLGRVTVGGTTLAPGQGFYRSTVRGDTVLVALTPLRLADESSDAAIALQAGEAAWVARGRHKWKNKAGTVARYITIEL